jgi:hypothetical protein
LISSATVAGHAAYCGELLGLNRPMLDVSRASHEPTIYMNDVAKLG